MVLVLLSALSAIEAAPVLLTSERCEEALVEATRAELEAGGFAVVAAPASEAVAAVSLRCAKTPAPLMVRIEDRLTNKTVERALEVEVSGPRGHARVAVQVIELLHASLVELRFTHSPRPPLPESVERMLEEPSVDRWRIWVGLTALGSSGLWRVEPAASAGIGRRLGRIELGVLATCAVVPATVASIGGSAEVGLFHASATFALVVERGALVLRPHAGLGVFGAWAVGHPQPGYLGNTGVVDASAPSLGISAEVSPRPWLTLAGDVLVGVPLAPLGLTLPESSSLMLGRPFGALSVGITLR